MLHDLIFIQLDLFRFYSSFRLYKFLDFSWISFVLLEALWLHNFTSIDILSINTLYDL